MIFLKKKSEDEPKCIPQTLAPNCKSYIYTHNDHVYIKTKEKSTFEIINYICGIIQLVFERIYQPVYGSNCKSQHINKRKGRKKENHLTLAKEKKINDHGCRSFFFLLQKQNYKQNNKTEETRKQKTEDRNQALEKRVPEASFLIRGGRSSGGEGCTVKTSSEYAPNLAKKSAQ